LIVAVNVLMFGTTHPKEMPMSDPLSDTNHYIPDPDIVGLARSIRALFAAILTRALKDIFKPTYSDHEIYQTQALHWIATDDPESVTSFINICNYLEIDVDHIRQTVNIELSRIEDGLTQRIQFNLGNYQLRAGRAS